MCTLSIGVEKLVLCRVEWIRCCRSIVLRRREESISECELQLGGRVRRVLTLASGSQTDILSTPSLQSASSHGTRSKYQAPKIQRTKFRVETLKSYSNRAYALFSHCGSNQSPRWLKLYLKVVPPTSLRPHRRATGIRQLSRTLESEFVCSNRSCMS